MEGEGRQLNNSEALKFMLAGDAKFTIKHKQTGNHLTYRIRKADLEKDNAPWFVSIKYNTSDEHKFKYIGCLWNNSNGVIYKHGDKSPIKYDAVPVKVFHHVLAGLVNGELHENFEIWHEGCCGRCGRTLTVPSSIDSGFGPECIKLVLVKGGVAA